MIRMQKCFVSLMSLTALLLTGCSPEEPDDAHYSFYDYDFESVEKTLKAAELDCESQLGCPENVGLIYWVEEPDSYRAEVNVCTGFLIAGDIVATNSHCVPKKPKAGEAECSDSIAIRFSNFKDRDRVFKCTKLLGFNDHVNEAEDYAFFKISPTGLKGFPIGKIGLIEGAKLKISKMNPHPTTNAASLETVECDTALNTIIEIVAPHPFAAVGTALGCNVMGGNSGSPMVNASGQVVGIAQAYLGDGYLAAIENEERYSNASLPKKLTPHVIFTNLACVKDPVTHSSAEQACQRAASLPFHECGGDKVQEIKEALHEFEGRLSDSFDYTIVLNKIRDEFVAAPHCVHSSEGGFIQDEAITLSNWQKKYVVGKDMRKQAQGTISRDSATLFRYELRKDNELWTGSMGVAKDLAENQSIPLSLPACKPNGVEPSQSNRYFYQLEADTQTDATEFYSKIKDEEALKCGV